MKNIFKKFKKTILIVLAAVLPVFAVLYFGIIRNNQPINHPVGKLPVAQIASSLANLTIPTEFQFKDETIPLTWTDDNSNENLIIKSDRQYYDGRDSSVVYFSITNISDQDQKPDIQFLFKDKEGRGVKEITLLNSQNNIISSGQTNFYKAVIYYPQNSNGEFFIEAKGDNGGYGYLDPYYASGLVGYWSLNGPDINNSTDSAYDRSSSYATGTMINMATSTRAVAGISGQALNFVTANSQYVDLGSGINPTAVTYSAWIKATSFPNAYNGVVARVNSTDSIYTGIWIKNNAKLAVYNTATAGVNYDGTGSYTLSAGTWYHVAYTYDSTSGLVGYVNAKIDKTVVANGNLNTTSVSLTIGRGGADLSTNQYFNGLIDEVRIYSRALSASEITDLYRLGLARMKINTPDTKAGPQDGLVGNWTFNGADMNWASTTAEALDRSSQNNNGNVINFGQSSAVPGVVGQALYFDGSDDYVLKSNPSWDFTANPTNTFSLSAWFKPNACTDLSGVMLSPFNPIGLRLTVRPTTWLFQLIAGSTYSTGGTCTVGEWTYVVGVYNAVDTKLYLYINGNLVDSDVVALTDTSAIADSLTVGYAGTYFNGLIDEVRVYNRALSASEITDLYRLGLARMKVNTPKTLAGPQSGLVGNWSFNGADMNWASTTAEALDRSGQNNNGNVTNFGQSSAVPGISGQALSFDGANDYVKLGAIALGGDTGTVVATFKADTWPSAGAAMGIIQRYYGDEGIYLRNDSGTKIIQGEVNGGGGVWHGYTSATAVSAGNWYTVAMTYDGLNVRLYVNGQESAASPDPQIGNWGYETYGWLVGSGGAYVPGSWEDLSSYFDGNIDEVRIYSRALSASEITDLYRLGSARLKSNQ